MGEQHAAYAEGLKSCLRDASRQPNMNSVRLTPEGSSDLIVDVSKFDITSDLFPERICKSTDQYHAGYDISVFELRKKSVGPSDPTLRPIHRAGPNKPLGTRRPVDPAIPVSDWTLFLRGCRVAIAIRNAMSLAMCLANAEETPTTNRYVETIRSRVQ